MLVSLNFLSFTICTDLYHQKWWSLIVSLQVPRR